MSRELSEHPLVSVAIPAFRAESFIEKTISSVRMQDHRPIEVVVVEDCSPDRTASEVERLAALWAEPGFEIRLLRQPENRGGAAALARGFSEARGEYLCWLSADDAFVGTTKLTEQVAELRARPGVSYATSYYMGPSVEDLAKDELVTASWDPARSYMDLVMRLSPRARLLGLLFRNPINGSTVMIDRDSWTRFGNFDASLGNIDQDSDLWMRYSALGATFSSIDTPSGFYRIHAGQTSNLREDCAIGASARRIRIIMAYERTGRLASLLLRTWPVMALAYRWEWYTERPLVAEYLCRAGLSKSRNLLVRRCLHRIGSELQSRNLVDLRLYALACSEADDTYESEEFGKFLAMLSRRRGGRSE